jgi:flagellar hook assembly protein FlgD
LPKALESIAETAKPQAFFVEAYPNPFNPSTQIRFAMKEAGMATLRIYNLNGQLIRELLREYRVAGEHAALWDGRDDRGVQSASGVYFIRFEAGNEVRMSKVMLVR